VFFTKAITNDRVFISRVMNDCGEFMDVDGMAFDYDRISMPRTRFIRVASSFSRTVTGSLNALIGFATLLLANEATSPFDAGFQLNDTLLSAAVTSDDRDSGRPRHAFRDLVVKASAP